MLEQLFGNPLAVGAFFASPAFDAGLVAAFVVLFVLFERFAWLDRNAEKMILVVAFAACTLIVAEEVFRRYVFREQAPWSTFVPSYLFLWLTWLGCSLCVRLRLHLNFSEIRDHLPAAWQYALMQFDYVLYVVFAVVVCYWSLDLAAMQWQGDSIVPGTDNTPSWIFYSATPLGWGLLLVRVAQNALEDWRDLKSGRSLKTRGEMISID